MDWYEYAEFNGGVHFFRFRLKIPILCKFGPENQNCQFKQKFGTKTNFNMQNSVVRAVHFFFFWMGIPLWGKFHIWSWSWYQKFEICTVHKLFTFFQFWPEKNPMVMVTFSIFNNKQSFLVNLVHQIKTPV